MGEVGEIGDSKISEQKSSVPFADIVRDLDRKMRDFAGDSFVLPKLLIPQRAPSQTPLYPTTSNFIEVEQAFNAVTSHDRSASVEDRGKEIFGFLLDLPKLRSSNEELIEARKDPDKLKEFYMKSEVMHEVRLSELLLDTNRANILGLWTKMSDENFQNFLGLVKEGKLPKCLTSDQEMKRLLDDSSTLQHPDKPKHVSNGVYETERPHLSSARERLVDLMLNPDHYVKDENGHAITPQLGGSKEYEFDPNINILSVMDKLREEFPDKEK